MKRQITWLGWLPIVSTGVVFTSVYIAWVAAYFQLGRRPMPSMDDPKFIGGPATAVYNAMGWIILISLATWIVGMGMNIVMSLLPRTENRGAWTLKFVGGFAMVALYLLFIRFSPGEAGSWFLD